MKQSGSSRLRANIRLSGEQRNRVEMLNLMEEGPAKAWHADCTETHERTHYSTVLTATVNLRADNSRCETKVSTL